MNTSTLRADGYRTFATLVLEPSTPLRRALLLVGGALLVALLAQISVRLPFTPVPVSGQTLGVLLAGAALGGSRGFRSMLLYLAAGVAGLPVFAGGGAGVGWLLGPTGGYLLAFPLAAWLVGYTVERWAADRHPLSSFAAMLVASALIYAGGLLGLAVWGALGGRAHGLVQLLALGVYPFVAGDLFKAALAAGLLPGAWGLARRFGKL